MAAARAQQTRFCSEGGSSPSEVSTLTATLIVFPFSRYKAAFHVEHAYLDLSGDADALQTEYS